MQGSGGIVYNSQDTEADQVPVSEGMDRENVLCTNSTELFSHKEE